MVTRSVNVGSRLGLDVSDFRKFARALRKAEPALNKAMRIRLREAGKLVADDAKSRIEPYSKSIPPGIKVRVGGVGVQVISGGKGKGPLPSLMELGSKGSGGRSIRHPLFGDFDHWYAQPTHPYLYAALKAKSDEAILLAATAIEETFDAVVGDMEM